MANGKHFIPGPGPAYDTFFNNVRQYTNAKCSPPDAPEWSHIPSPELAARNAA
jgi:hypothetical protein